MVCEGNGTKLIVRGIVLKGIQPCDFLYGIGIIAGKEKFAYVLFHSGIRAVNGIAVCYQHGRVDEDSEIESVILASDIDLVSAVCFLVLSIAYILEIIVVSVFFVEVIEHLFLHAL